MFSLYKKSLRYKLFVIFMMVSFIPFILFLSYTIFSSQNKIFQRTIDDQLSNAKVVINLVQNHLYSLNNEIIFLSSLDVMDDILADDIDKRVSRLLIQKAKDLNLEATFYVVGLNGDVVSCSDSKQISKNYDLSSLKKANNYYIKDETLYIDAKIKSSFNSEDIGYLILEYKLKNLDRYLTHTSNIHSYIKSPNFASTIGEKLDLDISFNSDTGYVIGDKLLVVYSKMSYILEDFYLIYAVDKDIALEFLYDFIYFMLYTAFVVFIFIIYISLKESRKIVEPIQKLTKLTKQITSTQDYSSNLKIDSQDEIGTLTNSFNEMLYVTSSALEKLEKENKLRLQRFTQLIELFNKIIQTKSEDECIEISTIEIENLTHKKLLFTKDEDKLLEGTSTKLYVNDFENDTKIYFGSISWGIDRFEDTNEENFYNSISSMITLQLDKINLIDRTMAASRAKSSFISNMSHELRTPLNAVIGFAQIMIEYEELSDEQNEIMTHIESSAQYLLSMINEILDMAKIEAGKMEAHIESVDVLSILQNSYNMLKPLAGEKNLLFEFEHENYSLDEIETDPKMLQQIVVNLMSNAIKFTEKGIVILSVKNNERGLSISVQDTGVGLSQDDIDKLFNDFVQISNVMQKKHKGTGLGLSISKQMAKMLNGDIKMYSEGKGCGTTAILSIGLI